MADHELRVVFEAGSVEKAAPARGFLEIRGVTAYVLDARGSAWVVVPAESYDAACAALDSSALYADPSRPKPAPAADPSRLICAACGAANELDSEFCDQCGETLNPE
jgi:ribosomal protein L40E